MHQVVLKRAARSQCFWGWLGGGSSDRGGGDNFITDPFDGIGGGCDVPCVFYSTVPTQVYQEAFVLTVRPMYFSSLLLRCSGRQGGAFTEPACFYVRFLCGDNQRKCKGRYLLDCDGYEIVQLRYQFEFPWVILLIDILL